MNVSTQNISRLSMLVFNHMRMSYMSSIFCFCFIFFFFLVRKEGNIVCEDNIHRKLAVHVVCRFSEPDVLVTAHAEHHPNISFRDNNTNPPNMEPKSIGFTTYYLAIDAGANNGLLSRQLSLSYIYNDFPFPSCSKHPQSAWQYVESEQTCVPTSQH